MAGVNREDPEPVHGHCTNCVSVNCKVLPITDHSCPMVTCPADCNAKFHRCKIDDHRNLCPNEVVPCLNHWNGCKKRMPRFSAKKHLKVCPSSHRGYSEDFKFVNFYVALKHYQEEEANKDLTDSESIHSKVSDTYESFHINDSSQSEMSNANESLHTNDSSQSEMTDANEPVHNDDSCQQQIADESKLVHTIANNISNGFCLLRKSLWVVPWQVQKSPEHEQFIQIHSSKCKCNVPSDQEMAPIMLPSDETHSEMSGFRMDELPYMTLRKIAGFLDAESLSKLSLVSYQMRMVCASWLHDHGSVTVIWEKINGKWVDSKRIWKF